MTARCSDSIGRRFRRAIDDESGAIVVFVAVILLVVLGSAGLAIDIGRGYLEHARLARVVDASALAAARSLRQGQATALAHGTAVASANGVVNGTNDTSISFQFGTNSDGESTVQVSASRPVPTTFMRVFGHTQMDVGASALAAVPPVDMVLVLDQSGSLESAGAWDELQAAAQSFVQHFSDGIDQVGLASYQLRATDRFLLNHGFTTPITNAIAVMQSAGDTNTGEGLRLADQQLQAFNVRPRSAKIVVFFTDGRPTALRRTLGGQDRMIAVYTTGNVVRGYFDNPDLLPSDAVASPDGCSNVNACFGMNENAVRAQARNEGLQAARTLRRNGVLILAIALGNPAAGDPLLTPDLSYLADIVNERGTGGPNQTRGQVYFAPSAAELQDVFDQVAQDLLVRLAQ